MTKIQNDALHWGMRLALTILLVSLATWDVRYRRVPNSVVQPLLVAGVAILLVRLVLGKIGPGALVVAGGTWAVCLVLWWLRAFGGGDIKLVMALIALAPEMRFVYLLLAAALGGLLLNLVLGEGRTGLRRLAALLA